MLGEAPLDELVSHRVEHVTEAVEDGERGDEPLAVQPEQRRQVLERPLPPVGRPLRVRRNRRVRLPRPGRLRGRRPNSELALVLEAEGLDAGLPSPDRQSAEKVHRLQLEVHRASGGQIELALSERIGQLTIGRRGRTPEAQQHSGLQQKALVIPDKIDNAEMILAPAGSQTASHLLEQHGRRLGRSEHHD